LLTFLGAVAVLALLVLRAAGVLAAMTFLRDSFRVRSGAWNILCHCQILAGLMARDAMVAGNVIPGFSMNAAALTGFKTDAFQTLGRKARGSILTLTIHGSNSR
jgi:hypothetical protein